MSSFLEVFSTTSFLQKLHLGILFNTQINKTFGIRYFQKWSLVCQFADGKVQSLSKV